MLADALRSAGYEVALCQKASECEAQVQKGPVPHLVVTSILLPDLDGLELTRRLRRFDRSIRILVVSALRARARASQAGADRFLSKPVRMADLLSTVQELGPRIPISASGDA